MAKPREIVSGMGTGFEVIKKIVHSLESIGCSEDDLRLILKKEYLSIEIAQAILNSKRIPNKGYYVTIPAFASFEDIALKYGIGLPSNAAPFGLKWHDVVSYNNHGTSVGLVIVNFGKPIDLCFLKKYFADNNLEPGRLEHLIALRTTHPEIKIPTPLYMLGSCFVEAHGWNFFPFLNSDNQIDWDKEDRDWTDSAMFLAVVKK